MKIAIIHDWLTGVRGGERCLEVFCELFPDADLYTLLHIPGAVSKVIEDRTIKASFIQRLPFATKGYRHYLPLFPLAIEGFNLRGYDLLLSSSHCVAKGIIPSPNALHVSYIHTPMRYVWDLYEDYFGRDRMGWLSRKAIGLFAHYLRMWDVTSSARVDYFVANSNHVAKRIEKYYRRKADVIYPPVDCSRFEISDEISEKSDDFYLAVSAFAPYKRLNIAIEAFNHMGLPLKIIGEGQDAKRLRKMAKSNIEFLGWQRDTALKEYYARCKALIFPGAEDFGIVPLEAMACGRPVIAYARGGVLETVIEGKTGIFFKEQTAESLIQAVKYFERMEDVFDPCEIRKNAERFNKERFKKEFRDFVDNKLKEFFI